MSKKMLIDATHPEETRVVVAEGSRVEDFDFESINKRQLAGNIYLAKVTRVEPSLQAAFVEYGGNRHGFLAFNEIHPDYYQIPRADREALLAAEAAEAEEDEEAEERPAKPRKVSRARGRTGGRRKASENPERATPPAAEESGLAADRPVMDAAEGAGVAAADSSETPAETGAEAAAEIAAETGPAPADVVGADPATEGAPPPVDAMAERPDAPLGEMDVAPTGDRVAVDNPEAPRLSDERRDADVKAPDDRLPESADVEAGAESVGLSAGAPPAEHMTAPEPDPTAYVAPETAAPEVETPGTEVEPAAEGRAEGEAPGVIEIGEGEEGETSEEAEASGRPPRSIAEDAGADQVERVTGEAEGEGEGGSKPRRRRRAKARKDAPRPGETPAEPADAPEDQIDTVGAEPVEEEVRPRRARPRSYKIQEVIKVRQILLVQVVKEERGTKGAALTTYLSLAGRYCVLMPNTARGGGISRKITSAEDRKKLKEIAAELEVPKGMGLIVRTAGAQRTRSEIRRDYEFLIRQWEQIRELTLRSVAPTLIYEEGSLIKRSIRDLYSKDIDEVLVAGEEGYREAKDYMRMLMPSHAKNVKPYRESTPLFSRHQVESYLGGMFNPTVQLKSGGYIVIGVTEALVAIDVNSGRSTREGSIEETALKTNLEAAEEIARQLRLRDLAGLIVIDFIDMDERRNNAAVEKRFKEKLKTDRARLQVGRISPFGLLEMSRQRLRPGMIEAVTTPCPHCHGQGTIRSDESLALSILREAEEEGVKGRSAEVRICAPVAVANYIINQKRTHLAAIEIRYGMSVAVEGDPGLLSPHYRLDRLKQATRPPLETTPAAISAESAYAGYDEGEAEEEGVKGRSAEVRICAPVAVANYIINQKRTHLAAIEIRYGMSVAVEGDPGLLSPHYRLDRLKQATRPPLEMAPAAISAESAYAGYDEDEQEETAEAAPAPEAAEPAREARREERREAPREARDDEDENARNRRRRGRRGGRKRRRGEENGREDGARAAEPMPVIGEEGAEPEVRRSAFGEEIGETPETAEEPARSEEARAGSRAEGSAPRRRRRRHGEERAPEAAEPAPAEAAAPAPSGEGEAVQAAAEAPWAPEQVGVEPPLDAPQPVDETRPDLTPQLDAAAAAGEDAVPVPPQREDRLADDTRPEALPDPAPEAQAREGAERAAESAPQPEAEPEAEAPQAEAAAQPAEEEPERPKRRGWWAAAAR